MLGSRLPQSKTGWTANCPVKNRKPCATSSRTRSVAKYFPERRLAQHTQPRPRQIGQFSFIVPT
jgi:hypothetical protein